MTTTTSTPGSVPGSVQRTDDPTIPSPRRDEGFFHDDQVDRLHRRDRRGAACVLLGEGEPTGTLTIPGRTWVQRRLSLTWVGIRGITGGGGFLDDVHHSASSTSSTGGYPSIEAASTEIWVDSCP